MSVRDFTQNYIEKDNRLANVSYFGTFAVYFSSLWIAIHWASVWWVVAPMVVINAFAGVRLYVLQHDCGHASLFETRAQNDWAGYGLSVFTLTPYKAMRYNHNVHHAHIGNLEHREAGEVNTMTLREWQQAGPWQRLYYRLYRNPVILLLVGGVFVYFLRYRWPKNTLRTGVAEVLAHNLGIALWLALIYALSGWVGIWVWVATAILAGAIGVFLVYLQHNFEDTYWDRRPDLDPQIAALKGSSALDLGWWWDLGTGNIAYHDIHHFDPRIPSYRLRRCHREISHALAPQTNIVRWPQALGAFRLKLWDEERGKLVPFPKAAQSTTSATA
ncbi:fatty acid desaturase [Thalassovita taeanensis]|uniref:Omega-6 fatty acid desaturase (Delta-12 desaturase) n=1 Tax=Thalassovita taeanensis TaxID=657014 RepID=A0A1H9HUD0_9RHOB|nr:fatty acid desaturase [Thalassovita taeanensis]SEQ65926.1 omega-6 fatty acid desaturase (delta-12 desaturase) [Thalassovita taeanensis]